MYVEAQDTALAESLVSSAQAVKMAPETGDIRLGLVGQVQNVVLCSDLNWDGQPLKDFFFLRGAHRSGV